MTHRDFVIAWMTNYRKGAGAIAAALGVDKHWLHNTATLLRRKGVRLPALEHVNGFTQKKKFSDKRNVAELNALIEG